MSGKRLLGASALAAVVATLGAWYFFLDPTEEGAASQARPTEPEQASPALAARATSRRSQSSTRAQAEVPTEPPMSARDQKVQAQLKVFMERTANITAESVAAEKKKVADGLQHALSREVEMPSTRVEVDEQGEQWERMEYRDGTVRYFPAPEGVGRP